MPDPVRRLPVPPLAGLEGQGCGALGSGGPAVWLLHSLPVRSSSIQGSHLSAFVPPLVHQRGGAERLYSGPCGQVRSGASSPAFSRFLLPAVRSLEDLRVLETRYRSLDPQLVRGRSSLPHGDHPVCTAVSSSGRLDGLHRPQGSLPAGPSIRTLVASFGLLLRDRFTSSLPSASACPRPLRSSLGSWLLFPPFSTLGVSA